MNASVEILEKNIYYTNSYLLFILGLCLTAIGIIGLFYFFAKIKKVTKITTTLFIIIMIIIIFGTGVTTASVTKDIYMNGKIPYIQYIIMLTPETDMHYLIKNYTFDREIYSNVWQITERKEIIDERRSKN